ncbi:MAG: deoxyribonuclease IV [Acidimicrobiaceae bacterium]|nr:deoxyribonuclease IV [Acidimicrobiaceae bacterium]
MDERLVGGHVSVSGGIMRAFDNADAIGANFIQIFTQSPRMWRSPIVTDEDASRFRDEMAKSGSVLRGLVTHASYLINLASLDPDILERSRNALRDNLATATKLGANGLVLHIGSHKGLGLEASIDGIVASLLLVFDQVEDSCRILLENTAGQGGSVGLTFEELAWVIGAAGGTDQIGVCLDTQHLFASGVSYETIAESDLVVARLSKTLGLSRLGCIHLNDSKVPLGSLRDRHENLGDGLIGSRALSNLVSHPGLSKVPLILETPGDGEGPRKIDVEMARELISAGQKRRVS